MSAGNWTEEQVTYLIDLYRDKEFLYNIRHKDYHKRDKRSDALNEIARNLQVIRPNSTESEVKAKINVLRTQFNRELHRVRNIPSGSGADFIKLKLWCFEQLLFLIDSTEERQSYNNLEESPAVDETQEIVDSFDETEKDTEVMEELASTASLSVKSPETGKRRKRTTVHEGTQELLSEMTKQITKMTEIENKPPDDLETFGNYIITEIRNFKYVSSQKKAKRAFLRAIQDIQDEEDSDT